MWRKSNEQFRLYSFYTIMKNLYIKLCLLALSAFFVQSLHAYDFEVDGIYYNITSSADKTVEVTYKNTSSNSYSGNISIPSTVYYSSTTYTVISINNYAFKYCMGLTSVTIPSSVTSIGHETFRGCTGLTSISIPSSVTSIDAYAFYGCSGLTSISIPSSVTYIGSSAFSKCNNLMDVALNSEEIVSKSYTTYNSLAGIFGSQVKQYTLGNKITSIGDYAFSSCTGLTSITIPSSVTSIGSSAFYNCI